MQRQKITTFFWFETQAEAAAKFYVDLFAPRSRIISTDRFGDSVMSVSFELEGQRYVALNGNTKFKFNDSMSLLVSCDGQAEVDLLWDKLLAEGGTPTQCGWLKDRFGVSWQVIPEGLMKALHDPDPAKAGRVMKAFRGMKKIDLAALERARKES